MPSARRPSLADDRHEHDDEIGSAGKILHGLLLGPCGSASALARASGLTGPTVRKFANLPDTVERPDHGALEASRFVNRQRGGYRLGPGLGLVLAFSVGREHLTGALVDASGEPHCVVDTDPTPNQTWDEPGTLLERIRSVAIEVLRTARETSALLTPTGSGVEHIKLIGATVAWPLPMDRATKPQDPMLKSGWNTRSMRAHLSDAIGLKLSRCHAIKDANAHAMALAFDQPEDAGVGSLMCVHLASGIRLGTVDRALARPNRLPFIDSRLVSGHTGIAGEIGHCRVDAGLVAELNAQTPPHMRDRGMLGELDATKPCNCTENAIGHLETVVGGHAVVERLPHVRSSAGPLIERLIKVRDDAATDQAVQLCLRQVGHVLARTLDAAVVAIDPAKIVLTGIHATDHVVTGMTNQRLNAHDLTDSVQIEAYRPPARIVEAHGLALGRHLIGLRGAALAVLRAALYRGIFDHPGFDLCDGFDSVWDRWSGWDHEHRSGAQTGKLLGTDAVWEYHPVSVDGPFMQALEAHRYSPPPT